MLVNSGAWTDLYAIAETTFKFIGLNLGGICPVRWLFHWSVTLGSKCRCTKSNKKRNMYHARNKSRSWSGESSKDPLKFQKMFIHPKIVQLSKYFIYLCVHIYFIYTYLYSYILILGDILVNILMAFQEQNGSFLKANVIYSYLAFQCGKTWSLFPSLPLLLLCTSIITVQ